MSKRKRGDDDDDDDQTHKDEQDRAQKTRTSRFQATIDKGNKSVASALKLARGFERQKLGRRQKSAKNDPKQLLRLKEEVIALKALDLGQTADKYLFKQLAKTKRIAESPTFVALYGAEPVVEGPRPGAEANVVGRLFNSNPIKHVMPGVMEAVLACLAVESSSGMDSGKKGGKVESLAKQKATAKSKASEEDEFEGLSVDEDTADLPSHGRRNRAEDAEESEDDEMAAYDDRLASDSAMYSESASSETFQPPANKPDGNNRHPPPPLADDVSLSPSPPPPPVPKSAVKAPKAAPKPAGTTTFLPSLMMGGYYSGSDSDDDDDGERHVESGKDPLQQKQRKNRRGQKARQEIAAKKHGKNANHLKKAAVKEGRNRDAGWDARKGPTEGSSRGRGFENRRGGRNNSKKPTGANSDAVVGRREFGVARGTIETKARENEGPPLHPSWEAAKKRKTQSLGPTQLFSGKKIKFD